MMEASVPTTAYGQGESEDDDGDSDDNMATMALKPMAFLSMLPPAPRPLAEEDEAEDDCSSTTSISLNMSSDSHLSVRIEPKQHENDGSDVLGEATNGSSTHYLSWLQEAEATAATLTATTTAQSTKSSIDRRKSWDCFVANEQAASMMDWIVLSPSSDPYCSAFTVLDSVLDDDHRQNHTPGGTTESGQEEMVREVSNVTGDDSDEKSDQDNHASEYGGFIVDIAISRNSPDDAIVDVQNLAAEAPYPSLYLLQGHQMPLSRGRTNCTPCLDPSQRGNSDVTSSQCDSIALTSYHDGGDDFWDEDDMLPEKTAMNQSLQSTTKKANQRIVTSRHAWRSAFASVGEVPSNRVYASPRDLYYKRRNMVARTILWR